MSHSMNGKNEADSQVDEAELSVSDESSYKQKLEVIQQQQELIEDEEKQEQVRFLAAKLRVMR